MYVIYYLLLLYHTLQTLISFITKCKMMYNYIYQNFNLYRVFL